MNPCPMGRVLMVLGRRNHWRSSPSAGTGLEGQSKEGGEKDTSGEGHETIGTAGHVPEETGRTASWEEH